MRCTTAATKVGLSVEPASFKYDSFQQSIRLSRRDAEINGSESNEDVNNTFPRIEVRTSRGRGLGLFAVDPISAYTKILQDDALLSLAQGEDLPHLWAKFNALPTELRVAFEALSYPSHIAAKEETIVSKLRQRGYSFVEAEAMARVNTRWQANAFKTGVADARAPVDSTWYYSLFANVARINHSCTPNACAHYRPPGMQAVYAIRDIEAGEEIEIAYFDMTISRPDRQARAQAWGFQCSCPACTDSAKFPGDEYEQLLSYVHQHLAVSDAYVDLDVAIESTERAIAIAHFEEYPWLVLALPKLYLRLYSLEIKQHNDKDQARQALVKALEWESKITGSNSPSSGSRRKALADFDADAARG